MPPQSWLYSVGWAMLLPNSLKYKTMVAMEVSDQCFGKNIVLWEMKGLWFLTNGNFVGKVVAAIIPLAKMEYCCKVQKIAWNLWKRTLNKGHLSIKDTTLHPKILPYYCAIMNLSNKGHLPIERLQCIILPSNSGHFGAQPPIAFWAPGC